MILDRSYKYYLVILWILIHLFLRPLTTEDIYANGGVSPNFTLKKDQDLDARLERTHLAGDGRFKNKKAQRVLSI